jgi:zinc/manganese transport system substrate-binding protein
VTPHLRPLGRLGIHHLGRLGIHHRTQLGLLGSVGACALGAIAVAGCGTASVAISNAGSGRILAVGAENQYANVISQIGGRYVAVAAIMSNPNTDPHTFEASPSVAHVVSSARLVVQNGVGYDTFMNKIEAASPDPNRKVIDVQSLLGLPASTANPHLWYKPTTMPAVAAALVRELSRLAPAHAAYFAANARRFDASLKPWLAALRSLKTEYPGTPVATTEPVGDYMLAAAGALIRTPWELQADIMNGVDPAPQDISLQDALLSDHDVKVFVYNQQVTDSLTQSFLKTAATHHVPVVGVYETMPLHYSYQSWMLAEARALRDAIIDGTSTRRL